MKGQETAEEVSALCEQQVAGPGQGRARLARVILALACWEAPMVLLQDSVHWSV